MKRKQCLSLVLAMLLMLATLSGCKPKTDINSQPETSQQTESQAEESQQTESQTEEAQQMESQAEESQQTESQQEESQAPEFPLVLADNEYATLTLTDAYVRDGFMLEVEAVNKTDSEMEISLDHETVNGMRLNLFWSNLLAPGETQNLQIYFQDGELEKQHLTAEEIHTVCFSFVGRWSEDGGESSFLSVCVFAPQGEAAVQEPVNYEPEEGDITLLQSEDYAFYVLGSRFENGALVFDCYAENNGDGLRAIWMEYALINEEYFEDAVVFTLPAGTRQYQEIRFEPYMLEDYGITEIDSVIFGLSVRDADGARLEEKEVVVIGK